MIQGLAVLDSDVVELIKDEDQLARRLASPTARVGIVIMRTTDDIFIPFDQKTVYLVRRKWDGYRATPINRSDVAQWKNMTKRMGQLKQEFVKKYLSEE